MNIFKAIVSDFLHFFSPRRKRGKVYLALLVFSVIATFVLLNKFYFAPKQVEVTEETKPVVSLVRVSDLGAKTQFSTIGTVEAISEAKLMTEAGGQVTVVRVELGQSVQAGTIIASLENQAQRAALTQAEGAYEAALAASKQSTLSADKAATGVREALNSASNGYRSAYTTTNDIVLNSLDRFYSGGVAGTIGFRLGNSRASYFTTERVAFRSLLMTWQTKSQTDLTKDNVTIELQSAMANIERLVAVVAALAERTATAKSDEMLNGATVSSYNASLLADQATLNGLLSSLRSAQANYETAVKTAEQASAASTSGGALSSTNAQIKIALGALQAARAAYDKSLVRTPISGVVNALYLKVGDYVAPGQPAAIVANNQGLQIKTYLTEADAALLNTGDQVKIDDDVAGVISAKASAIDPTTGKVALVVGINSDSKMVNGSTVNVTFTPSLEGDELEQSKLFLPLTAIKVSASETTLFSVTDGALVAHPITLGEFSGDYVEVTSPLDQTLSIVADARGLRAGQLVTVQ